MCENKGNGADNTYGFIIFYKRNKYVWYKKDGPFPLSAMLRLVRALFSRRCALVKKTAFTEKVIILTYKK